MLPAAFCLFSLGIFPINVPLTWLLAVRQNPRIAMADHVWLSDGEIMLATFSACMVVPRTAKDIPVL